jgi:hypothetical protein
MRDRQQQHPGKKEPPEPDRPKKHAKALFQQLHVASPSRISLGAEARKLLFGAGARGDSGSNGPGVDSHAMIPDSATLHPYRTYRSASAFWFRISLIRFSSAGYCFSNKDAQEGRICLLHSPAQYVIEDKTRPLKRLTFMAQQQL